MKLCLNTHALAGGLTPEELAALCLRGGIGGVEFSVGYGHKHGVELDAADGALIAIRDRMYAVGVEVVSLASYCRFDMPDEAGVEENLARARRGIDMASVMDAPVFRVVGNDLPDFMPRDAFVERMAGVVSLLGEYAQQRGVEVLLNMHGSFNFRRDVARVMELAGRGNVGLVYNCAPEDVVGGTVELAIERVLPYVRHVHLHELTDGYPYIDLFARMKDAGYSGWYSIVVDDPSPETDRFLAYYTALARAWYHGAKRGG